ncbi:hypothetical protein NPIL_518901 [Nephila pilipes]|uniref:C2H2-type domain-containing protein n=1 Tax=Nephila pilipes TaxID=299642 RepID=A0A8X6K9Q3_NEPPI|nr:hypothetical protein NPIL_518901 [Nephila pilipes]
MEFRCDYCKEVFYSIEHYLRHKYITHDGQKLRPLTSNDRLTWDSFLENFAAWSGRESANTSTRRQVNANETVDTSVGVENHSFATVDIDHIPIRQQMMLQGETSSSGCHASQTKLRLRPSSTQSSETQDGKKSHALGMQFSPPISRNKTCMAIRCSQMHSGNPSMRPEICTYETSFEVSDPTRPSIDILYSQIENIDNQRETSTVNRGTKNLITNFEN